MHTAQHPKRWMVILAFGLVYLFWGSTYLGIDIAVQTIPPALMCARAVFDCGRDHAGGVRRHRAQDLLFAAANRAGRDRGPSVADGRQSYPLLRGAFGFLGTGGADHCHHAAVVSGARLPAAGRPPHFRTRQSGTHRSAFWAGRPGVAAVAVGHAWAIANSGPRSA